MKRMDDANPPLLWVARRPPWANPPPFHLWLCFSGESRCWSVISRGSERIYWQRIRLSFHQEVSTADRTQESDGKTNAERGFLRETKLKPSVCLCGSQRGGRAAGSHACCVRSHEGVGTVCSSGSQPFWLVWPLKKIIGGLLSHTSTGF